MQENTEIHLKILDLWLNSCSHQSILLYNKKMLKILITSCFKQVSIALLQLKEHAVLYIYKDHRKQKSFLYTELLSQSSLVVATSKEMQAAVKSVAALCYTVEAFRAIKAYLLHHSIVQDSNPHLKPLAFVFFQVTWLPPTLKSLLAIPTNHA